MFRIVTWSVEKCLWEETNIAGASYTQAVERLLSAGPRPGVRYAVQSQDPHGVTQRVELFDLGTDAQSPSVAREPEIGQPAPPATMRDALVTCRDLFAARLNAGYITADEEDALDMLNWLLRPGSGATTSPPANT